MARRLARFALVLVGVCGAAGKDPAWPYEEDVARAFASLTAASYCGADDRLQNWTCRSCEDVGIHVDFTTLRFSDFKSRYVEDGFFSIWRNVQGEVLDKLREIGCVPRHSEISNSSNSSSNLYITGHSLGAAVGTIAMCTLQGPVTRGKHSILDRFVEGNSTGNACDCT
eukprot:Skav222865  [mRNA]  locus=scaffold2201:286523:289938:- [translate_table: standard]